jgi:hypothetical protein
MARLEAFANRQYAAVMRRFTYDGENRLVPAQSVPAGPHTRMMEAGRG